MKPSANGIPCPAGPEWTSDPVEDLRRSARRSFRRLVRERIQRYDRTKLLPALLYCPDGWLEANSMQISTAILRRLTLTLYQQRQARATLHYTYSSGRYEALLVAIGGELNIKRQLSLRVVEMQPPKTCRRPVEMHNHRR